jgi:nitroreductase
MSVYNLIKKRRSVRSFLKKEVSPARIKKILDAGRWAPSGLNNQPWRFIVVKNKSLKDKLSRFTESSCVIRRADCAILVFLDKNHSYNKTKDIQAIGSCIQNMLLCAKELGISSCWLGEILNRKNSVNKLIGIPLRYDLMAAVALGYSRKIPASRRVNLRKLILKEFR